MLLLSVVKEIERINEKELDLALSGASWHDEYKGESAESTLHYTTNGHCGKTLRTSLLAGFILSLQKEM